MKSNTRQDYLDRICRVLRFVQEHLDKDLSPAILADVANLSIYHFRKCSGSPAACAVSYRELPGRREDIRAIDDCRWRAACSAQTRRPSGSITTIRSQSPPVSCEVTRA
jgi:hypothetical protein